MATMSWVGAVKYDGGWDGGKDGTETQSGTPTAGHRTNCFAVLDEKRFPTFPSRCLMTMSDTHMKRGWETGGLCGGPTPKYIIFEILQNWFSS